MRSGHLSPLTWQFELTWKLAASHLPRLTDEVCLWQPAPGSWTVRQGADGNWRPDWAVPEPEPAPVVTIGWLTWQMIWWWSGLLAAASQAAPPAHDAVYWPGSAAAVWQRLVELAAEHRSWLSQLTAADLDQPLAYPWTDPRPLGYALAWANSELMKNVAEIGYVRHLFAAARP
jgi:hypothetical protein